MFAALVEVSHEPSQRLNFPMIRSISSALSLALLGALSSGCATTATPEATTAHAHHREPAASPERIATSSRCNDWALYFETGSASLSDESTAMLGGLAECIQRGDVRDVIVTGSADPRGAAPENLELGRQRAEAIRAVLVARGCDPSVVRTASVGEARASGDPQTYASERHASVHTHDRAR